MTTSTPPTQIAEPRCPEPVALTVQQACKTLGISKWALYQLIRSRQLETIKIGRLRRIPSCSIHAFIESQLREDNV